MHDPIKFLSRSVARGQGLEVEKVCAKIDKMTRIVVADSRHGHSGHLPWSIRSYIREARRRRNTACGHLNVRLYTVNSR